MVLAVEHGTQLAQQPPAREHHGLRVGWRLRRLGEAMDERVERQQHVALQQEDGHLDEPAPVRARVGG
eukprot:1009015-Prymnesium_polylepis.1